MAYGIESPLPHPPDGCFGIEVAARQFEVSAGQLKRYVREGLLIPLKSRRGIAYYTGRDREWITTIGRLLEEAHLSFDEIRRLIVSRCTCWKIRHCDFHSKNECPLISDSSKPCWVNRYRCPVLCSYPCYSCTVYRSAPQCDALKEALNAAAPGAAAGSCYYGG